MSRDLLEGSVYLELIFEPEQEIQAMRVLYGFGAFLVMNFIVWPLSAAPSLPVPTPFQLIETIIDHVLTIGLPLGILISRHTHIKK